MAVAVHSSASRRRCSHRRLAALTARLRGERSAVQLQVELAGPDRRVGIFLEGLGEERGRGLERDARKALQVGRAADGGDHLAGGTAAAVAVSEGDERPGRSPGLGVGARRVDELGRRHLGVVGVDRREVGEQPGAVDPLPPERVMRETVGLIPRQLLGEHEPVPRQGGELRERCGIAEGVGHPHVLGLDPELVEEEALAVDHLTDKRLATREVAVRLDPQAADQHDPPRRDRRLHPLVELRTVGAQPVVAAGPD